MTSEITTRARSIDGDLITMVVEIEYLTDADQVEKVYLEVGHDSGTKARVIDPEVQTAMKSNTLQFTTEQLLTEHAMIENQLLETLTE